MCPRVIPKAHTILPILIAERNDNCKKAGNCANETRTGSSDNIHTKKIKLKKYTMLFTAFSTKNEEKISYAHLRISLREPFGYDSVIK